jgi:hypothetical protein
MRGYIKRPSPQATVDAGSIADWLAVLGNAWLLRNGITDRA